VRNFEDLPASNAIAARLITSMFDGGRVLRSLIEI